MASNHTQLRFSCNSKFNSQRVEYENIGKRTCAGDVSVELSVVQCYQGITEQRAEHGQEWNDAVQVLLLHLHPS